MRMATLGPGPPIAASWSRPLIWCTWRAQGTVAAAATQLYVQLNGISAADYLWQAMQGNNTTAASLDSSGAVDFMQLATICAASATSGYFSSGQFILDGCNQTTTSVTAQGSATAFVTTSNSYAGTYGGLYNNTAATVVSSVTLLPGAGSFAAGSQFSFYGMN